MVIEENQAIGQIKHITRSSLPLPQPKKAEEEEKAPDRFSVAKKF
jgi:hypothetical protein